MLASSMISSRPDTEASESDVSDSSELIGVDSPSSVSLSLSGSRTYSPKKLMLVTCTSCVSPPYLTM